MKFIYKAVLVFATVAWGLTSCSSYLDVVPDEDVKESDTYADYEAGRDYLYSCYGLLPNPQAGPKSLDLMTGDEVAAAFFQGSEIFSRFPEGNYSASKPVISYWNDFFQSIRQCYMFLEAVEKLPGGQGGTSEEQKKDYRAQAKFLIAYLHYQMIRCYGSIILVKELPNINMTIADYPARAPFDECVAWVANLFDEAAQDLPAERVNLQEFGLATSTAAKSLKAKLLLYAASPLFNGNPAYADFKDNDGVQLMPTQKDPNKWVLAKNAAKEAIDLAEATGFALYTKEDYRITSNEIPTGVTRCMRTLLIDWSEKNPEVIFADPRDCGAYSIQNKSYPRGKENNMAAWNGIAPTWAMLNRFYTKNGLPWDEDPDFKNLDKYEVVTVAATQEDQARVGEKTILFNLEREPRFYAWVGFHGGYYELREGDKGVYPGFYQEDGKNAVILNFLRDGLQGISGQGVKHTQDYSLTGYLNKKGCDPTVGVRKSGSQYSKYPWPIIRLADLYLMYAEACAETGDLQNAKAYTDKVRERAGIPTVDKAWTEHAGISIDQKKMIDIVRGERMVEFYLENQNFWDMRRWLLAGEVFNKKVHGMNLEANSIDDFAKDATVFLERKFVSPKNYLLPIPITDINNNPRLVQNPGY